MILEAAYKHSCFRNWQFRIGLISFADILILNRTFSQQRPFFTGAGSAGICIMVPVFHLCYAKIYIARQSIYFLPFFLRHKYCLKLNYYCYVSVNLTRQ